MTEIDHTDEHAGTPDEELLREHVIAGDHELHHLDILLSEILGHDPTDLQ